MASVESSLEDPVGHAMATASANAHEPPTDNGSESSSDYFTSSEFDEDHSHGNSHISNDSSHSDLLPPVGDTDSSSMALDDDNYEFFSDENGYLSYIDNYDIFWHAYLNDKEIIISKLMNTYKSIYFQRGRNILKFRYEPFRY